MRLSLLTPEYPPGEKLGGIATHTHTMARALARLGHTVQVVTPWKAGGLPAGTSIEGGVTVNRVDPGPRLHAVVDRFRTNRRLADAVRAFRPDVVHAAEFDADAWWLSRFSTIPVVTRLATPTGLVMEIPEGLEGQVRPRSGLALKHGITCLNTPGTVDSDYRGEVKVLLVNLGDEDFTVERGMRVAQIVFAPVVQVRVEQVESTESLGETTRGAGGFGSSGR